MELPPLQNQELVHQIYRDAVRAWQALNYAQSRLLAPLTILQDVQYPNVEHRTTSICHLLQETKKNKENAAYPYRNFRLRDWDIETDHYDKLSGEGAARLTQLFWSLYGQNVTTLTLSHCKIPYNFTLLPLGLWRAVPNLEHLTLAHCVLKQKPTINLQFRNRLDARILRLEEYLTEEGLTINLLKERLHRSNIPRVCAMLSARIDAQLENFSVCLLQYHALSDVRKEMTEVELEGVLEKLRADSQDLAINPVKLKVLHLHNVTCKNARFPMEWSGIMNMFPNLQRVSVRQQELGVMNLFGFLGLMHKETIWKQPAQKPFKLHWSRMLIWPRLEGNGLTWNPCNWLTQVSLSDGIFNVYLSQRNFQKLKIFTCKSCPCRVRVDGVPKLHATNEPGSITGSKVVVTCKSMQQMMIESSSQNCFHVLFDNVSSNGVGNVDIFIRVSNTYLHLHF